MPYAGEVRMFAGNQAPDPWLPCDGQLIYVSGENQYMSLLESISNRFGGDGVRSFCLPDLRGRAPMHQGRSIFGDTYSLGQSGGAETVTLTPEQLPVHAHPFYGSTLGSTQANPQNAFLAAPLAPGLAPYGTASPRVALAPEAISESGGSGAHANVQPFVALTFIISWATIPYVGNQSLIVDDPLIGEVRLFSRAAPNGWLTCDGQILQISANEKLHAVIGNRFGGDGVDTFALPNLQGATAIGVGQGPGLTARTLGERGGSTHVALTDESLPRHSHAMLASAAPGSQASPSGQSPARSTNLGMYAQPVTTVALAGGSVGAAGGGLGHDNMQPYLGLLFCIAVEGDGP